MDEGLSKFLNIIGKGNTQIEDINIYDFLNVNDKGNNILHEIIIKENNTNNTNNTNNKNEIKIEYSSNKSSNEIDFMTVIYLLGHSPIICAQNILYILLNMRNNENKLPLDIIYHTHLLLFCNYLFDDILCKNTFYHMQNIIDSIFLSIHQYYDYNKNSIIYSNFIQSSINSKCTNIKNRDENRCKSVKNYGKRESIRNIINKIISNLLYKILSHIKIFPKFEKYILYSKFLNGLMEETPYSLIHLIFNENENFTYIDKNLQKSNKLYNYILDDSDVVLEKELYSDIIKTLFTKKDINGNTILHILLYSNITQKGILNIYEILKVYDLLNQIALIQNNLKLNIFDIILLSLFREYSKPSYKKNKNNENIDTNTKIMSVERNTTINKYYIFMIYYDELNIENKNKLNILEKMFKMNFVSYEIFLYIINDNGDKLINFIRQKNINNLFINYLNNLNDLIFNETLIINIYHVIKYLININNNNIYYLFLQNVIFASIYYSNNKSNILHSLSLLNNIFSNILIFDIVNNIIENTQTDDETILFSKLITDIYHDQKNNDEKTVNEILKLNKTYCLRRKIKNICGMISKINKINTKNQSSNDLPCNGITFIPSTKIQRISNFFIRSTSEIFTTRSTLLSNLLKIKLGNLYSQNKQNIIQYNKLDETRPFPSHYKKKNINKKKSILSKLGITTPQKQVINQPKTIPQEVPPKQTSKSFFTNPSGYFLGRK